MIKSVTDDNKYHLVNRGHVKMNFYKFNKEIYK